jgi:hypothetical protein
MRIIKHFYRYKVKKNISYSCFVPVDLSLYNLSIINQVPDPLQRLEVLLTSSVSKGVNSELANRGENLLELFVVKQEYDL